MYTPVPGSFSSRPNARADCRHVGPSLGPSFYLQVNRWGRGKHITACGIMGVRGLSHSSYSTQVPAPSWCPGAHRTPLLPWATCLSLNTCICLTVLSSSPRTHLSLSSSDKSMVVPCLDSSENTALLKFNSLLPQRTTGKLSSQMNFFFLNFRKLITMNIIHSYFFF